MFRSPPQLRSGSKGQPVPLSTSDKRKLQRSLSVSSAESSAMPADSQPKSTTTIDPAIVEGCVNKYLSGEEAFGRLILRLTEELRGVVEAAVSAAVAPLTAELTRLRGEVTSLTGKLRVLEDRLIDRTDDLEQHQRRNNLRIFGIQETANEDTDAIVAKLCRDKLRVELPAHSICRSHRVGRQPEPSADGRRRHRPIIVRFVSYQDRRVVYGAKKNLKATGITIKEDLTARRVEVLRKATAAYGIRNTWTLDGKVFWVDGGGVRGSATRPADLVAATNGNTLSVQ